MQPLQSFVSVVGWVQRIYDSKEDEVYVFRLLQPGHHEHFNQAVEDAHRQVGVHVIPSGGQLTDLCRAHLQVGHRVQIVGYFVADGDGNNSIEALSIERAEPLETFRFVNHRWNLELKTSSPATLLKLERPSDEDSSHDRTPQ